jgi:hypothetical protein
VAACASLIASPAAGQGPPVTSSWDVSVQTGAFLNHPPGDDSIYDNWDHWYSAPNLGVSVGRYLTSHLKLEAEYIFNGSGERFRYRHEQVPGVGLFTVGTEEKTTVRNASAVVVWQFRDNQWVHPFVFTGASVDTEEVQLHTWPQYTYRGDPRIPANQVTVVDESFESFSNTRVLGLVGLGAKLYVSQGAYFRTDSRIAIGGNDGRHVSFRLGFGVDF